MRALWQKMLELSDAGTPFVVITMVDMRGEAPQEPGAKAIVSEQGLVCGTVGGGKVEARAIEHAIAVLAKRSEYTSPVLMTWNLQRDIGMTCGGEARYLFELHNAKKWEVVVFGAGHVAQAVVRVLQPLNCHITCVDHRPEWVERLPKASNIKALCLSGPARFIDEVSPAAFFVVMTQGHATDVPIFDAIFRRFPKPVYIGGIGSDIKAIKIRAELKDRGIPIESLEHLHCPIGLPLGGNDPQEIAISVAAQLLQCRGTTR